MHTRFDRRYGTTYNRGRMWIGVEVRTGTRTRTKTRKEDGMAQARRTAGMDFNTYYATQFIFKCSGEGGSPISLFTPNTPKHPYFSLITPKFPHSVSPFGVVLEERDFSSSSYRYTFQNQEHDDELKGEGNSINFTYRMHDPRLGRFLSVDPLVKQFASISSYAFSENSVIAFIDLEGLEKFYAANGEFIGQLGNSDEKRFINQHDDNDTYTLNKFKREFKKI